MAYRPSTSQGGPPAPPYTADSAFSYDHNRPGTAAGGGGGGGRRRDPNNPSDDRPSTSRAGRGMTGDSRPYTAGTGFGEEDEEEYEESEDEDVFAFLPPNTAQGQQLQQLQNAQAARRQAQQHAQQLATLPEGGGAFAYSYPGEVPGTGTDSVGSGGPGQAPYSGNTGSTPYSATPATPASSVPLQQALASGRYAHQQHSQQPSSAVYSMASTPPVTASTQSNLPPPFSYDGGAEHYQMAPLSSAGTVDSAGNMMAPPSSMASSQQQDMGARYSIDNPSTRPSREIVHHVALPGRAVTRKSGDKDGGEPPIGASTTFAPGHGRNRSLGAVEADLGGDEGLRYRPDSKRTKTGSSQDSDLRDPAAASMRSVKTDISLTNAPYTPTTLPSSGGHHHQHYTNTYDMMDEDAEDSPYPEVRASVSNVDDPEMPASTVRMWFLGIVLCAVGSALNMFFNFRYPAPYVAPLILLLLAHPLGKLLALILPIQIWTVPTWIPLIGGKDWSLNPGPFNIKEHVLIFMMANVSINPAYAMNVIVVTEKYYNYNLTTGFTILLVLGTQLTGFGLSGFCRRFLVWPASLIWPANLVTCTLLNTLHAEDEEVDEAGAGGGGGMTRYKFYMWATTATFFWYFVPGFLFQALSTFSYICWIRPNNVVVNQLFGVVSGLGMGIFTFDWSQISYIGSPLMVPWWAEVHIFVGFAIFYWILTPIMYYRNVWDMAYFPMSGDGPYDRFGLPYNVTAVITPDMRLNVTAYEDYSPLYLPATYIMTYLLAFMLATAILVHTGLYHGKALLNGIKRLKTEEDDVHAKLMRNYPEVPDWWYALIFFTFFIMAIIAVEIGHTEMPVWALILAIILPIIYIIPSSYIYAMTGQPVGINLLAEVIPGALLQGQPIGNMMFKSYAVQTMQSALAFTQDLKLGHYVKVPPRATFMAQFFATFVAALAQVGTKVWMFKNIPDLCQPDQPHDLTCPSNEVYFAASAVWGLIGPARQFGAGAVYHPQLYALIIGAVLPIPFWWWQKRWPKSIIRYVNIPVMLNGPTFIPPATGINYSSWFGVGVIFQYIVRTRNFRWWSKFNYILSASLDSGTIISVIFVFFTLQFPKGGNIGIKWWGNEVFLNTADYLGVPLLTAPADGF